MSQSSICPMCHFQTPTMALCLSHLRLVHASDPQFCVRCRIDGCTYSGKSFSALYSHIYRKHPQCGAIHKRGHGDTTSLDLQQSQNDTTSCAALSDNSTSGREQELQGL